MSHEDENDDGLPWQAIATSKSPYLNNEMLSVDGVTVRIVGANVDEVTDPEDRQRKVAKIALALEEADLHRIRDAAAAASRVLMVGFNRRFAPQVQRIKSLLAGAVGPKAFVMTVNAGSIPASHWTQDREVGGGRLVGEGCHFIDLLRFLSGSPIVQHQVAAMDGPTRDSATVSLRFADGSLGTLLYLANGSKTFPKERLEVFAAGRVLQLDNFRRLAGFGWPGFSRMNLWRQDKGQQACARAFVSAIEQGGPAPIPLEELLEVSRVSIAVEDALR